MLNIVLVRHGEAEAAAAGGDAERPLTERGRSDARALGQLLGQGAVGRLRVVTSPFRRARETGELIARGCGADSPEALECLVPGATGELLFDRLRDEDGWGAETIVVVAHAPDIAEILAYLLSGGAAPWIYGFPPGASALLRFSSRHPRPGRARLAFFLVPDGTRMLGRADG